VIKARLAAVALMALVAAPVSMAQAEVVTQSPAGFVIKLSADTTATQNDAWKALITPNKWWSGEHTYNRRCEQPLARRASHRLFLREATEAH
jgi:hypothetical protein